MRTVKRNPFLSGVCAILGGLFLWAGAARADVASDRAAAILVVPKVVFDSSGRFSPNDKPTDTEIQVTNVSNQKVNVRCFYVDAVSHCSNSPSNACFTTLDCQTFGAGGICVPGWVETDFAFTLTPHQPIVWQASLGLTSLPDGETVVAGNSGNIPPVGEDPFFGELKCVEVDDNEAPTDRNDLKGEATIVAADKGGIDARGYNAVGVEAIQGINDGNDTLILGGSDAEYNGCPNVLILDHFFDDAIEPITGDAVKTHLTLVPCSEDFLNQNTFFTTVQLLVFNEFEQRFSASRPLNCFHEFELCSLGLQSGQDRPIDDDDPASQSCQRSIFSAFVEGTLTGQTRIRGTSSGQPTEFTDHGDGLLGVAEEFFRSDPDDLDTVVTSDAFNVHQSGERTTPDFIVMPAAK
jgi:hypothetical protein